MKQRQSIVKIMIVVIVLAVAVIGTIIFFGKSQILQYSVETLIRNALPDFVTIDKVALDLPGSKVAIRGFTIHNPKGKGYPAKPLVQIDEIECGYKLKNSGIFDGIELVNPVFKRPVITIARLPDGKFNINEILQLVQNGQVKQALERQSSSKSTKVIAGLTPTQVSISKNKNLSDMITLPEKFAVSEGKVTFIDNFIKPPQSLSLESVKADISLKFDRSFSRALYFATIGTGAINGNARQTIQWDIKCDPTAPKLTMSNRLNVSQVTIKTFEPYFDQYSPLTFSRGNVSGVLVFDFDNGNIGSMNEVRLSDLVFSVKPGFENAMALQTAVPDLVKYFTSASGDVIFDFKIKGAMSNPQFYLGPISKQAIAAMAIDKIGQALSDASKAQGSPSAEEATGKKSDIEKASEYIKMFKSMIKE